MYALAAGTASDWLRGNPRFLRAERWISGTVLVGWADGCAVRAEPTK